MLPISFEIIGLDLSKTDLRRAQKLANTAAGEFWHRKLAGRHWASGAAQRYGYQPRKRGYLARKIKAARKGKALAGGVVPLLYTGAMRQLMTHSHVNHSTPTYIKVRMKGPRYVSMRPWKSGFPNLAAEATAVAADERPLIQAAWTRHMEALIQAVFRGRQSREKIG